MRTAHLRSLGYFFLGVITIVLLLNLIFRFLFVADRADLQTAVVLSASPTQKLLNSSNYEFFRLSLEPKDPISATAEDYFYDIALGSEFGSSSDANKVRKWVKPEVSLITKGKSSAGDMTCLTKVVADFNDLSAESQLQLIEAEDADVTMHFAPTASFSRIESNYVPGNEGFAWIYWGANLKLARGTILISTDGVTDVERCHLIREELTQSMGLLRDSSQYTDSIFYGPWTRTNQYSDLDEEVIKALYGGYLLEPGDTKSDVALKLKWWRHLAEQ